jgi:hypothetical protein
MKLWQSFEFFVGKLTIDQGIKKNVFCMGVKRGALT